MLIDVCRAKLSRPDASNERLGFLVMAGVGLDAQMIEYTDEDLKRRIGPLAYISGIARSLRGGNRIKVTYTVDGHRTHATKLHTLIFGNCGELINEIPLLPEARPDDGLLNPDPPVVNFADLEYSEGSHVKAFFAAPEIFEVDGDPVGEVTAVEISVDAGALKVCV